MFLTRINLWTTMKFCFQDQLFMEKRRKNSQGVLFSRCRSKTEMQNMFGGLHFKRFL